MIGVNPIYKCVTYHTGDYYKTENTECTAIDGCIVSVADSCNPHNGAKLVDFYVASSHQSCHVPSAYGNYVSTEMLKTVLVGGARLVDFDVYAEVVHNDIKPVVRSSWFNTLSQNYILIEDIWETISNYGFEDLYDDPLIVHLNIKTKNVGVMDHIAKTFTQYISMVNICCHQDIHIIQKSQLRREPICTVLGKIILVATGSTKHTLLDELIHLHTSHNARLLEAKQVKSPRKS